MSEDTTQHTETENTNLLAVVMRGLPGSGKSSWIRKNLPSGTVVCSADHMFIDPDGVYRFDHTKLGAAHARCQETFRQALEAKVPVVVVDNTNVARREVRKYRDLALGAGYQVRVVRLICDPEVCVSRNVHGVSRETIATMNKILSSPQETGWSEETYETSPPPTSVSGS